MIIVIIQLNTTPRCCRWLRLFNILTNFHFCLNFFFRISKHFCNINFFFSFNLLCFFHQHTHIHSLAYLLTPMRASQPTTLSHTVAPLFTHRNLFSYFFYFFVGFSRHLIYLFPFFLSPIQYLLFSFLLDISRNINFSCLYFSLFQYFYGFLLDIFHFIRYTGYTPIHVSFVRSATEFDCQNQSDSKT